MFCDCQQLTVCPQMYSANLTVLQDGRFLLWQTWVWAWVKIIRTANIYGNWPLTFLSPLFWVLCFIDVWQVFITYHNFPTAVISSLFGCWLVSNIIKQFCHKSGSNWKTQPWCWLAQLNLNEEKKNNRIPTRTQRGRKGRFFFFFPFLFSHKY